MFQVKKASFWNILGLSTTLSLIFAERALACENAFEEEGFLSLNSISAESILHPSREQLVANLIYLLLSSVAAILPFFAYDFFFRAQKRINHPAWVNGLFSIPFAVAVFIGFLGALNIFGATMSLFLLHSYSSKLLYLGICLSVFSLLLFFLQRSSRASVSNYLLRILFLPLAGELLISAGIVVVG